MERENILTSRGFSRLTKLLVMGMGLVMGFIACVSLAQAQEKYTISGYIKEKGSQELLPSVTIYLPQLETGTVTNLYGFYSLTLDAGQHVIRYSYVGYHTHYDTVELRSNRAIDVILIPEVLFLEEVIVETERPELKSEKAQMGQITLATKTVEELPAFLGEKDVLKVLQLLPGVQSGSEGSSGLYVRGGGPDQNLIILDDALVYNVNHLFGFFSVFNGDAIKSIELYKGGFPARFGGRLSSVLNMTMKDGNKEGYHGKIGVGVVSTQLSFEGPIRKNTTSFLVSARRTYLDLLVRPFIDNPAGYYFQDVNAKINHVFSPRDKLYLSAYYGVDRVYFEEESSTLSQDFYLRWGNVTSTMRWNHEFSSKVFANTSFIFSHYNYTNGLEYQEKGSDLFSGKFRSLITDYSLKYDMDIYPALGHTIRTGGIATLHVFNPDARKFTSGSEVLSETDSEYTAIEAALYAEDEFTLGPILANLGLRGSYFQHADKTYTSLEPRVSLGVKVAPGTTVKGSYALMNQYLHLLTNAATSLPTDLWVSATDRVSPQRSQQVSLGAVKDFINWDVTVSIETYYKWTSALISYKEGANTLNEDGGGDWQDKVTRGNGEAYGAEFLVQKSWGDFTGWIGYTLAWTRHTFKDLNGGRTFFPRYDRRHDVSLVGIYKLQERYIFSLAWVYGSGGNYDLPLYFTSLPSQNTFYGHTPSVSNPLKGDEGTYTTGTDENEGSSGRAINHERYNFRGEPFHRLDFNVQFRKRRGTYKVRTWEIGAYNAYARKNPFFYTTEVDEGETRIVVKRVSLLPIMVPYVSFRYEF